MGPPPYLIRPFEVRLTFYLLQYSIHRFLEHRINHLGVALGSLIEKNLFLVS